MSLHYLGLHMKPMQVVKWDGSNDAEVVAYIEVAWPQAGGNGLRNFRIDQSGPAPKFKYDEWSYSTPNGWNPTGNVYEYPISVGDYITNADYDIGGIPNVVNTAGYWLADQYGHPIA